jgi:hypothetical protein
VGAHDPQVAEVLARASDVWDRFVATIARIDPAVVGASMSTEAWTPKQIVGHVAFWDGYAVDHPEQLVHGLTLGEAEWEPLNTATARGIAESAWEDVLSQLHTNHAQMMALIDRTPELSVEMAREWTCDHYLEHERELSEVLAADGRVDSLGSPQPGVR